MKQSKHRDSCFWFSFSSITVNYLENKKNGVKVKGMHDHQPSVCWCWFYLDPWKGVGALVDWQEEHFAVNWVVGGTVSNLLCVWKRVSSWYLLPLGSCWDALPRVELPSSPHVPAFIPATFCGLCLHTQSLKMYPGPVTELIHPSHVN